MPVIICIVFPDPAPKNIPLFCGWPYRHDIRATCLTGHAGREIAFSGSGIAVYKDHRGFCQPLPESAQSAQLTVMLAGSAAQKIGSQLLPGGIVLSTPLQVGLQQTEQLLPARFRIALPADVPGAGSQFCNSLAAGT